MTPLTCRQKELYDFIVQHVAEQGYQPSYEDMMRHMWVNSPNAVRSMIVVLERKGYVQRTGKARAMKIIGREH